MIAGEHRTPTFLDKYFLNQLEDQVWRRLAHFSDVQRHQIPHHNRRG